MTATKFGHDDSILRRILRRVVRVFIDRATRSRLILPVRNPLPRKAEVGSVINESWPKINEGRKVNEIYEYETELLFDKCYLCFTFLFPLWRAIRNRFRPRSNEISQTELAVHERTFTATSGLLRAVQNILASATACLVNCNAANGGINSFTRDGSRVHPFTGGAIREK